MKFWEILKKFFKKPAGKILLRAVPIALSVTLFAVGSFSLARYVSSSKLKETAGVAKMGVEVLELVEGKPEFVVDKSRVVPGADIAGPHVKLRIHSEVSFALFVKVTVSKDLPEYNGYIEGKEGPEYVTHYKTVYFEPGASWEIHGTPVEEGENYVYTYRFKQIFKPATLYDFTGTNEIRILDGDVIYVSQYYSYPLRDSRDEQSEGAHRPDFTIAFEAYVRQVQE